MLYPCTPIGAVAKWYGRGLQNLHPRFKSGRHLQETRDLLIAAGGHERCSQGICLGFHGVLTQYPVDMSIYEWAIERGYFTPRRPDHRTPLFIGGLTPDDDR
jgi:hypothetical protein